MPNTNRHTYFAAHDIANPGADCGTKSTTYPSAVIFTNTCTIVHSNNGTKCIPIVRADSGSYNADGSAHQSSHHDWYDVLPDI